MGQLDEYIARAANKEDGVKGRFWEGRFKSQALLDEAAIAAGMVYVDLNPIRGGLAATPEGSEFSSIQERIRAWQKETMGAGGVSPGRAQDASGLPSEGFNRENAGEVRGSNSDGIPAENNTFDSAVSSWCWLCPIQSDSRRRGILHMSAEEYFDLVDRSGRMLRPDKRGAIKADLAPILQRIGINPDTWDETVSQFGSRFCLAAGLFSHLRNFADQLGRRWLKGFAAARLAFVPS